MTDVYGPEKRSAVMRRVKGRNTAPEMTVRRALTKLGARYRLHRKDLPGNPDIVLPGRKLAIFVHGCFWHGHDCPQGRAAPNFHTGAWGQKIAVNHERDRLHQAALHQAGWHVEAVWECQVERPGIVEALAARLLQR